MKTETSSLAALTQIANPISLDSIMMFAPRRDDSQWASDRYGRASIGAQDVTGDLARRIGY